MAKCGFKTAFSYRDNNKYLAICNKLANTRKHFKITRGQDSDIPLRTYLKPNDEVTIFFSSTGNSSQYHNGNMPVNIAPTSILSTGDFIIETDNMIIKVLDLINECINSWHEYLEQNNIDYKSNSLRHLAKTLLLMPRSSAISVIPLSDLKVNDTASRLNSSLCFLRFPAIPQTPP